MFATHNVVATIAIISRQKKIQINIIGVIGATIQNHSVLPLPSILAFNGE